MSGPDITGWVSDDNNIGSNATYCGGAFSKESKSSGKSKDGGWTGAWYQANFAASASDAIYGKSSTVQSNAVQTLMIIKV